MPFFKLVCSLRQLRTKLRERAGILTEVGVTTDKIEVGKFQGIAEIIAVLIETFPVMQHPL